MSRRYEVDPKHLVRINRPPRLTEDSNEVIYNHPENKYLSSSTISRRAPWNPVNSKYYEESSSDDNDDESNEDQEDRRVFAMPLTPSTLNMSVPQVQIIPPSVFDIGQSRSGTRRRYI